MRGKTTFHIRWKLFFYDVIVFAVTSVFLLVLYEGPVKLTQRGELQQMLLAFVCVFACRLVGKIYGQIWRYGGIQCYMRLVCTDCVAFLIYVILESVLPVAHISFPRLLVLSTVNTMGALIMRMSYRYAYKCSNLETFSGKILAALLKILAGIEVGETRDDQKIKVAIIGAGNVGVTLAGELLANKMASYVPKCFVDIDKSKDGREIQGLPVLSENEATFQKLKKYGIQEIIFALPSMADERRTERYLYYKNAGYKVKMYDYPKMQMAGGKRALREFDIGELLFRAPRKLTNEKTKDYYSEAKKAVSNALSEENKEEFKKNLSKATDAITTGAKSIKSSIDETISKPEVQEKITKAKDYIEKGANTVADLFKKDKDEE